MKRTGLLVLAGIVLAGTALYLVTRDVLTLDTLQQRREALVAVLHARPFVTAAGYLAVYVAITALSIPGAAILTLAGGMLFGWLWGTVLVSFASTIGATAAFLIARTVCNTLVRERFGERLERVRRGFERDGAFYLFSLRLVPAIPFFVVNVLMALTSIRTPTFFLVSQLGMLPATVVYVNAGTRLAEVRSASDILSPGLLAAFALLAVFPWLARWLLRALRGS